MTYDNICVSLSWCCFLFWCSVFFLRTDIFLFPDEPTKKMDIFTKLCETYIRIHPRSLTARPSKNGGLEGSDPFLLGETVTFQGFPLAVELGEGIKPENSKVTDHSPNTFLPNIHHVTLPETNIAPENRPPQ